jgi:hypothetical protein
MSARADIRAGMVVILDAFKTASPTYLAAVHEVRPTRFSGDLPLGFVDFLTEDLDHTSGTQGRTSSPSFVFVFRPIENRDQVDLTDAAVDAFIEHLKDYAYIARTAATVAVWRGNSRVTDESIEYATGEVYPAVRIVLNEVDVRTGRTT